MKATVEKYLPYFLILLGGIRVLAERFPSRLSFLLSPDIRNCAWLFWLTGLAGVFWLVIRAVSGEDGIPRKSDEQNAAGLRGFFNKYGTECVILLLTAVSLSMLIHSGYFWDDAVNSTVYLAEKKDSVPLIRHVLDFMHNYLALGRINVLSFYYYFFFYIENVSVYKILIILSILINQLIFRKVLLEYDVPLPYARIGMLLFPLLLQTRLYQDPVSGFYSLMQVLTAEMLWTALFLSRWMRDGRGRGLLFSLLAYTAGLMTYEVCFPFLLMVCLLIWARRGSFLRAVRDSLPFVGVTVVLLAAIFLVRMKFVTYTTYEGVAFSLDLSRILRTAFMQFTAGLPLSFYTAASQGAVLGNVYPADSFMNYDFFSFLKSVQMTDVLIVFAGVFLLYILKKHTENERNRGVHPASSELLILGLSFAVLPIITVAMSERYQGQLLPGLGYLPVYMQYFGVAVLLLWLIMKMKSADGAWAFCFGAFVLIWLLNVQNNRAVTDIMNRSFYHPRNAGESSLKGGMLDFLPQDAVLVSLNDRNYLWEANWDNVGLYEAFYGNWSRHMPSAVGDNQLLRRSIDEALSSGSLPDDDGYLLIEPENTWVIFYHGGSEQGLTRLGRLCRAEVNVDDFTVRNAETDHMMYFVNGSFPEQASVQYCASDGIYKQIPVSGQLRVRRNDMGILYQLPETERIWFDSLSLLF